MLIVNFFNLHKNVFLKILIIILLNLFISNIVFARSNSELTNLLYTVANKNCASNQSYCDELKSNIASFLIDINLLNFNESTAKWKKLPSGYLYDENSLQNFYLRHIGVYKSLEGKLMGVFDLNCEDFNDMQERSFGYVNRTEVYLVPNYKASRGRSLGVVKTFCKQ